MGQTAAGECRRVDRRGSLAAWLWLLLGQGFFWRTDCGCRRVGEPDDWPSVCVVVPARDEAAVLPESLPSLLAQDYPGRAEIFLVDDGSSDGAGELARALPARTAGCRSPSTRPGSRRGLDRQALGRASRYRPGTRAWPRVPAADGRGHRARAGQPADAGRRGAAGSSTWSRRWPGCGWRACRERRRPRLRLLLRTALSLPVDRGEGLTDGGRGGRLRTAARGRRSGTPDAIRHAVIDDVALARAVGDGGHIWLGLAERVDERASLSPAARPVAHGLAQRVRPAAAQPAAAPRYGPRPRRGVPGAPGRRLHGSLLRAYGGRGGRRARVAADDGDVSADAALLPAARVAGRRRCP